MRSLRARILFTASLVLVTFLSAAGVLLDRAFRDSALDAVEDRLRGQIFMLIGVADFDAAQIDASLAALPDPTLSTPGSGHYARIRGAAGLDLWTSASMLGMAEVRDAAADTGVWQMRRITTAAGSELFGLSYGIVWEGEGEQPPRRFTIEAFESDTLYTTTVGRFRRNLWSWFAGLSFVLILVQAINLSRGLRPLALVGNEVRAIERGELDQLGAEYPDELVPLTQNINALLRHNRDSLQRYRNALGDLAHAIKTPLAVLRNEFESARSGGRASPEVLEQLTRIDNTVQYQLQRAAAAGRSLMTPPLAVAPIVERVASSLRKVYGPAGKDIEIRIAGDVLFSGDEGDLMEIVGNLADNACKWARRQVCITGSNQYDDAGPGCFVLVVEDDGPGIPADKLDSLTERGVRLDESVEGHGIGLAIVREMVEGAYGGKLDIESAPTGTRIGVRLELPRGNTADGTL